MILFLLIFSAILKGFSIIFLSMGLLGWVFMEWLFKFDISSTWKRGKWRYKVLELNFSKILAHLFKKSHSHCSQALLPLSRVDSWIRMSFNFLIKQHFKVSYLSMMENILIINFFWFCTCFSFLSDFIILLIFKYSSKNFYMKM